MSVRRRKNPVALALGVGVVGLLAAGAAWWYVSQKGAEGATSRLLDVNRSFDKKRAKTLAAEAVTARGGKRVGVPLSSLRPGVVRIGARYQPSEVDASASEPAPEGSSDSSDLTQPFDPSAGAPV